jgi:hypothetical protein
MGLTPAKKDDLTEKEKLFLKYYTDEKQETFGNGVKSAMKVWPDQEYDSAKTTAYRVLTKTEVKIKDLLEKKGLSEGKIVGKIAEWLEAKKIKSSMTEPDKIVEDYQTQLKAGEMLIKLSGLEPVTNQVNVQVNVSPILGELKAE